MITGIKYHSKTIKYLKHKQFEILKICTSGLAVSEDFALYDMLKYMSPETKTQSPILQQWQEQAENISLYDI